MIPYGALFPRPDWSMHGLEGPPHAEPDPTNSTAAIAASVRLDTNVSPCSLRRHRRCEADFLAGVETAVCRNSTGHPAGGPQFINLPDLDQWIGKGDGHEFTRHAQLRELIRGAFLATARPFTRFRWNQMPSPFFSTGHNTST